MSGIILYKSKYGATKKYAEWISEATGFRCVETKNAKLDEVKKYDTIVLGGGIYAGGIAGISFLRKHFKELKEKKIVVFTDGASPYDERFFNQLVAQNLKDELAKIPCFYCRGAYDLENMGFEVMRFTNDEIFRNLPDVLDKIFNKIAKPASSKR